jgi:ABC-type dipeptide/oligopeptide/nickel transport system ATPase component
VLALVGSSGSGKSLTARALLGLVTCRPGLTAGRVVLDTGERVLELREPADFRLARGGLVGLLPQDARASLDPLWTIGRQVAAAARLGGSGETVDACLVRAGFADPGAVARAWPHELSGGMAQRAAIALALARRSRFLIADEPTTGLDPAIQRALLAELLRLREDGIGILFITHDLRLLPGFADRLLVMDAGRIVEEAAGPASLRGGGRPLLEATRRISGGVL